jgi:hypothetical protein
MWLGTGTVCDKREGLSEPTERMLACSEKSSCLDLVIF